MNTCDIYVYMYLHTHLHVHTHIHLIKFYTSIHLDIQTYTYRGGESVRAAHKPN